MINTTEMRFLFSFFVILFANFLFSQNNLNDLIGALLADTPIEEDLQELCDDIGGRVTGSEANKQAVEWSYKKFLEAGLDVNKDPFQMPSLWLPKGTQVSIDQFDFSPLVVAKYHSPPGEYASELVYIGKGTKNDFEATGNARIKGNFLLVDTDICFEIGDLFAEYEHTARVEFEAIKREALGIIFMSSRPKKLLYRVFTAKRMDNKIPQIVMAREDAQRCARLLKSGRRLDVKVEINAEVGGAFTSENVIAEIKGAKKPEEVILVGAHLDSWALGTGANDNGANVCLMIDIARQMKKMGIMPSRTIKFALWNGEEQGYLGSMAYANAHQDSLEQIKMVLSVDIGSGGLTGFFTNGREELIPIVDEVLKPVSGLGDFVNLNFPIVGTDNFDFMLHGVPNLVGNHKPQLYGPNYHASSDTFDKVDLKQLKLNSAIVASLTFGFANLSDTKTRTLKRQDRHEVEKIIEEFDLEFSMRMVNVWDPWINGERGRK